LENLIDWSQPSDSGKILWQGQSLQATLKRGWYFGAQEFRENLLSCLETEKANLERKTARRYTRGELKADDEQVAEAIVCAGLKELGLAHRALADLPKKRSSESPASAHHRGTNQRAAKMDCANPSHGQCPLLSKLAKEMKQAIPRSKKGRDVKQSMIRFITSPLFPAYAGTICGVESNAMQFYPEASSEFLKVHPGLYQRRGGILDLSTLSGPGFGYAGVEGI
jgi:hypothetical protein